MLQRTLIVMTGGNAHFHARSLLEYIKHDSTGSLTKLVNAVADRVVVLENNGAEMSPYQTQKQREIFFGILSDTIVANKMFRHQLIQAAINKWAERGEQMTLLNEAIRDETKNLSKHIILKIRHQLEDWTKNSNLVIENENSSVKIDLSLLEHKLPKLQDSLSHSEWEFFDENQDEMEAQIITYITMNYKLIKEAGESIQQGKLCFPGSCSMTVQGKGKVTMERLEAGDSVLNSKTNGNLQFEEVFLFSHAEREVTTCFVEVLTEQGKKITLSSNHLIPISKMDALKPARDIRVGDNIFVVTTDKKSPVVDAVVNVTTVIASGLYCPHTASGTLIVDGVLVSCYSTVVPVWVQRVLVTPLAWLYRWLPSTLCHKVLPSDGQAGMSRVITLLRKLV